MRLFLKIVLLIMIGSVLGFLGWFVTYLLSIFDSLPFNASMSPLTLIVVGWISGGQGQRSVFV